MRVGSACCEKSRSEWDEVAVREWEATTSFAEEERVESESESVAFASGGEGREEE